MQFIRHALDQAALAKKEQFSALFVAFGRVKRDYEAG